ncbi:MAG: sugar transferase [Bacteroidales bacterium]|nr:sugar transferase [Bacteroidales bacterium]
MKAKPGGSSGYFSSYLNSFFIFLAVWIFISAVLRKYKLTGYSGSGDVLKAVLVSNLIIFFVITSMIYLFQNFHYSRFIVLGTVGVSTFAELTLGLLYFLVISTKIRYENGRIFDFANGSALLQKPMIPVKRQNKDKIKIDTKSRIEFLKNEIGEEAFNFILHYGAIDSPDALIIGTNTRFTVDVQIQPLFESIINVNRVNDFRYINKFFESVNAKLPVGGVFIDYFETKTMRKARILKKFPFGINYLYYAVDFTIKRVLPKFTLTKKLYFLLTRGINRVLSKAETFGRLYSCGFEVLDEKQIGNNLFFVALKVKEPSYPKNPSYGPLIALERIGKGGKPIKVFKMRTMHPFAEYLQDYMYKRDGLQAGGKFRDDFRITTMGKIMRTFWIDELPMLINLVKGDLKIFGVRPLSRQYYKLYTPELQKLRIRSKPGLIPPFYVHYPRTLEEIMNSELQYLKAYEKHPFRTDWVYFWKAIYNILYRKYRST